MRLLYLDWPHLPLRLETARLGAAVELAVLGGRPWDAGDVLDCSSRAQALGVRRGQPLGSAHNLVPEATFIPADRPAYRAAFEIALEALADFTPALEGESDPDHRTFGQVFLGIEGLDRLWGDEGALTGRVVGRLASLLPGRPRVGIGNTRFGAQVAAIVGRGEPGTIGRGGAETEAAYLAPLPIRLLPADGELRDRFRLFGLSRIGDFAALPRSAVLARFGTPGGDLHDLARGLDGRPLRPRRAIERLRAEAQLEPPVEELGALRFVLHNLAGVLCEQLSARGAGASRATLTLELERAPELRLEQALPEPAAVPDLLERLLLARLEAAPPTAAVERLTLELDGTAPAAGQQLGLFTPQLARAARLDWQLLGLAIRFGSEHVLGARLLDPEAMLAEDRFEWRHAVPGIEHGSAPEVGA
jgi:nucleotidyltransferase/DNA polymerase involved in DNA repair